MNLELTREALGWCTLINMGLLFYWSLMMLFGRGFVHRMHCRFIPLSEERFNGIHYAGMAIYKLAIFVFNLVPWIALHIVG